MGCYNETCILTRLPILHGDRCRVMFVAPQLPGHQNPCHPWGMFTPATPAFSGGYDDYGNLEDIEKDDIAYGILANIKMRTRSGEPVALPVSPVSEQDYVEALQNAIEMAGRFELEAWLSDPNEKPGWRPLYAVFMHEKFAGMLTAAGMSSLDPEYVGSVTFRLCFTGPMRDALRYLDPVWGQDVPKDAPMIDKTHADELCALMSGMSRMRIGFAPACGAGSQDATDDGWQREFYLEAWARSESIARRGDDEPLHFFSCCEAWDGNWLSTSRNEDLSPGFESLMYKDPHEMFTSALRACAQNIVAAIDEDAQPCEE